MNTDVSIREKGKPRASLIGLILLAQLLAACATNQPSYSELNRKLQKQRTLASRQQEELRDLKARNLVLTQKLADLKEQLKTNNIAPAIPFTMPASGVAATAPTVAPALLSLPGNVPLSSGGAVSAPSVDLVTATSPPAGSHEVLESSERLLLNGVSSGYRHQNLPELDHSLSLLLKTYPESIFADNALFMKAQLLFQRGQDRSADETLELILKNYPIGDRVPAVLLLQSKILKKNGKMTLAKPLLARIAKDYPGSPEAVEAVTGLHLDSGQLAAEGSLQ